MGWEKQQHSPRMSSAEWHRNDKSKKGGAQREERKEWKIFKKKRAKEGESQLDIQSSSPQTSFHQSLHQREESLSYAIVLHIAFKIYVPARIMQLDDCVEKTPINLILFGFGFFFFFFFFWLPFFLLQRRSNPLSLLSLAIICPRLHPDFCF